MDGGESTQFWGGIEDASQDALPFRLGDVQIKPWFIDVHPMITQIRNELLFQWRLFRLDWNTQYTVAVTSAIFAVLLGALNGDIFDGGNAKIAGLEGLQVAGSTAYFQMVLSVVCWAWFLFSMLQLFPIMRTHTVTLLLIWGGLGIAQVYFHSNNKDFPLSFSLSDMMGGFLITLVCIFFLYFFIKAVRETRDLHVETHHIHEDVRVMEASMREHSLSGWTFVCLTWTTGALLSAWTGAHYIAERTGSRTWALVLHLLFSIITIPLMVWTIWFPQKMLGNETRVRTKAAVTAEEDLMSKADLVEVSPDEEAW
ncbi:MAG TPA: hypothetical protein D7I00_03160 [Candidatus Poseidoniales archaeon]|mgnify:FL=1|nr:MAG TPA: hypothetical protein D7I00_03160 [Candidatus Poseidoniales archaeon]HII24740.1 hypothetical protein [Candidatus Poseidoniaceae archaeon]|tara:strand:- start:578 stop:1513 length:936 start_codon:yes stop_codon:yes gene_type:complete